MRMASRRLLPWPEIGRSNRPLCLLGVAAASGYLSTFSGDLLECRSAAFVSSDKANQEPDAETAAPMVTRTQSSGKS